MGLVVVFLIVVNLGGRMSNLVGNLGAKLSGPVYKEQVCCQPAPPPPPAPRAPHPARPPRSPGWNPAGAQPIFCQLPAAPTHAFWCRRRSEVFRAGARSSAVSSLFWSGSASASPISQTIWVSNRCACVVRGAVCLQPLPPWRWVHTGADEATHSSATVALCMQVTRKGLTVEATQKLFADYQADADRLPEPQWSGEREDALVLIKHVQVWSGGFNGARACTIPWAGMRCACSNAVELMTPVIASVTMEQKRFNDFSTLKYLQNRTRTW